MRLVRLAVPCTCLDVIDALRKQISLTNCSNNSVRMNTMFIPQVPVPREYGKEGTPEISYPLLTKHARRVYDGVRENVILHESPDILWHDYNPFESLEYSMVAFLQIFTDKMHTSLKASSVAAYPIHLTLQNFDDPLRRICINSGLSIIDYI